MELALTRFPLFPSPSTCSLHFPPFFSTQTARLLDIYVDGELMIKELGLATDPFPPPLPPPPFPSPPPPAIVCTDRPSAGHLCGRRAHGQGAGSGHCGGRWCALCRHTQSCV
ncbi:unnamed protein product, partial [Closterium sp. NIES-53]